MRLKLNATTAVVVKKSWANLSAIKLFLRDQSPDEIESSETLRSCAPLGRTNASVPTLLAEIELPANDRPEMELTKMERADESHTIFARVLDDTDERGLWIELNTNEHEKDPCRRTASAHDSLARGACGRDWERLCFGGGGKSQGWSRADQSWEREWEQESCEQKSWERESRENERQFKAAVGCGALLRLDGRMRPSLRGLRLDGRGRPSPHLRPSPHWFVS